MMIVVCTLFGLLLIGLLTLVSEVFYFKHSDPPDDGSRKPTGCVKCGSVEFYKDFDAAQRAIAAEVFSTGRVIATDVDYSADGKICKQCGLNKRFIG